MDQVLQYLGVDATSVKNKKRTGVDRKLSSSGLKMFFIDPALRTHIVFEIDKNAISI